MTLETLGPDPSRTARTRARCHERLARQARSHPPRRFGVENALLFAFGAVYLCSIAIDVMRVLIR